MRLGIALPTYNESDNIEKIVAAIQAAVKNLNLSTTLLIVDDNSPDGTGKLADKMARTAKTNQFKIMVLHRRNKEGLGKAYVAGFKKLIDQGCSHILQMDADFSHNPKYIPDMVKASADSEFVVGSRYIPGGSTPDWTWDRKLQSNLGNIYTRFFLGNKIHDYTGGFNIYSTELLEKIDVDSLQSGGYGFQIELKYHATQLANGITEVPIVFLDRTEGQSKIPHNTIYKNLLLVPQLRFRKK